MVKFIKAFFNPRTVELWEKVDCLEVTVNMDTNPDRQATLYFHLEESNLGNRKYIVDAIGPKDLAQESVSRYKEIKAYEKVYKWKHKLTSTLQIKSYEEARADRMGYLNLEEKINAKKKEAWSFLSQRFQVIEARKHSKEND